MKRKNQRRKHLKKMCRGIGIFLEGMLDNYSRYTPFIAEYSILILFFDSSCSFLLPQVPIINETVCNGPSRDEPDFRIVLDVSGQNLNDGDIVFAFDVVETLDSTCCVEAIGVNFVLGRVGWPVMFKPV